MELRDASWELQIRSSEVVVHGGRASWKGDGWMLGGPSSLGPTLLEEWSRNNDGSLIENGISIVGVMTSA